MVLKSKAAPDAVGSDHERRNDRPHGAIARTRANRQHAQLVAQLLRRRRRPPKQSRGDGRSSRQPEEPYGRDSYAAEEAMFRGVEAISLHRTVSAILARLSDHDRHDLRHCYTGRCWRGELAERLVA